MTIRTGLIGYGRNGSTMHATPIATLADFEMVAVCDIDQVARDKASERFDCPVYADYQEMLQQEQLDFVVVVTYNHQHAPMAIDCLRAGVDVLVTKPWAVDAKEASTLIEVAKTSGKKLLPWLPSRWGSQLLYLRQLIEDNTIGNVFQVRRSVHTFGRRFDWQTRADHAGGYLRNWGPHIVDQPIQLLGEHVQSVYAKMRQIINPGDVEDVFYAMFTLETGQIITCEFNIATGSYPEWMVQGDRGTVHITGSHADIYQLRFDTASDTTAYRSKEERSHRHEDIPGSIYGDEMHIYQEIAATLKGEKPYPIQLDSALYLTKLLDAIRQSATKDRLVFLKEE